MDVGFTVTSLGFETVPIMSVQALEIGERPRRNMENVLTLRYLVRTMLRAGGVGGGGAGGNGDQGGGGVEVVKVIVVVMKVGLVVLVLVVGHVDRHAINVVDNMVYCVNFRQDH